MESLEFSDEEIKRQLAELGYFNITEARMKQFRKDLHKLIEHDRSTSGSSSWFTGVSSPSSNSDISDSLGRQPQAPSLSRFQPHVKCPSQRTMHETDSTLQSEPSWMAKYDTTQSPSHTDTDVAPTAFYNPITEQTKDLDAFKSLTLTNGTTKFTEQSQWTDTALNIQQSSYDDEENESDRTSTPTPPPNGQLKVIRKRKVLRKQSDGTPRVFDESLMEDPSRGTYRIHDVSVDDSDPRLSRVTQKQQLPPRPHSARPMLWKKTPDFNSFVTADQPPSYIRPNTSHPHTRNIKKTDPVNRFHQYRDFWNVVKAPGEKSHKSLRWEVKAQMMYKEEPAPKPQRVYVPNTYVVPTSKKRSALRWEVRHAMEQGLPIPSTYDVY
ncbi:uncharacterized protein LOC143462886 [Clavelina lepadiformis]|uniref:Centriolar and ciliogenesis-associated protein HYLS1 C-terminal domain-containing protein n=1 Tax=Clavelina lepadiformis TaxID=159417 RepID=A0ABP0GLZ7_CLALP